MEKNNLSQIFENSKSHIDKTIYSYLFMLMKYIFFWKNRIKNKERKNEIIKKLEDFTDKINKNIIIVKSKYIKIEPFKDAFSLDNFNNILNFIKKQNNIYAGDIIEGILIVIFSYSFETSKENEFGKYLYINMSKLRDVMNPDIIDWFKKASNTFQSNELKSIRQLLNNDFSITDFRNHEPDFPLIHKFLIEITKLKFNSINLNNGKNKNFEYINKGNLELIQAFLNKFRSMKSYQNNLTMLDKDFMSNSMAFLYYYLFEEPSIPPIKIIRCFLISIYIYYQNEHSPLMEYSKPYIKKDDKNNKDEKNNNDDKDNNKNDNKDDKENKNDQVNKDNKNDNKDNKDDKNNKNNKDNEDEEDEEDEDDKEDEILETIPFTYSLKGAFIEGRFSNTIMSPIKVEPGITNINFAQNNIRELGLYELGKTISMSKHIKSMILKISLVRTYFLDYFISGIGIYFNNNVEEINLSMNYLKEDCGYSLMNFLSHFKNLKILHLSSNELKSAAKYVFIFLKKQYRKKKCKLENLYINNCLLDDSSFYELGELLKSKYCKLKILSIGSNNKPRVINFLKKIRHNRYLEELNIFKAGLRREDIEDICKIISNSNLKHLSLFKNQLNNFTDCLKIVFRSKLVKKKDELKEEQKYIIDKSSSLMTLDLSNCDFDRLNCAYINLVNELIKKNNSTIGCLDLSHIFYGLYPDKNTKTKSEKYRKAIEVDLANNIKERKEKFCELSFNKYSKDISIKKYENMKEEKKIEFKSKNIIQKVMDIIHKPLEINNSNNQDNSKETYNDNKQHLVIKEKSKEFYEELKKLKKRGEYDEDLKIIEDDNANEQKKDKLIKKLINYMKYKRDKEECDEINRELIDKNLILI